LDKIGKHLHKEKALKQEEVVFFSIHYDHYVDQTLDIIIKGQSEEERR
jgi:hypothetical protein